MHILFSSSLWYSMPMLFDAFRDVTFYFFLFQITSSAKPPRLAQSVKVSSLFYGVFCRFESHLGRKASRRCTRSATL